jgi:hypothetical protein
MVETVSELLWPKRLLPSCFSVRLRRCVALRSMRKTRFPAVALNLWSVLTKPSVCPLSDHADSLVGRSMSTFLIASAVIVSGSICLATAYSWVVRAMYGRPQ